MQQEGLNARLVLQVHDELIVECPTEEAETVMQLVTEEMTSAASSRYRWWQTPTWEAVGMKQNNLP